MSKSAIFALSLVVAGAFFGASPVLSQSSGGMTESEISEAFSKQKTRGLVIAPSSNQAPASTDSSTTEPAAVASATHIELPKDEQVNIQISFDFDSAALREDQKPRLTALCNVMKSVDIPVFRIVGHTDASGSAEYNNSLSLLRAQEVKRYLESDCGIAPSRLEAVGVGEQFPYDAANPRADANRRVEFQALS